jgi:hypothetical protein
MNARSVTVLAATTFLLWLLVLFASMGGPAVAAAAAAAAGGLSVFLLRAFEAELPNPWLAVAPPLAAAVLGVSVWGLAQPRLDRLYWLAPMLAAAVAAAIVWWQNRDARRCGLCNCRLAGKISFVCPRCHLEVCETRCWDFEKIRCRLCVQNAVPLFPPTRQWWDRNVGPGVTAGRCQVCQVGPEEAELRACPRCGRPQCIECWDDANGLCARCGWRVPALPEALKQFLAEAR